MKIQNYNIQSEFTRRIFIDASQPMVFSSWSVPGEMELWSISGASFSDSKGSPRAIDEYIQEGDLLKWNFDKSACEAQEGVVSELIPNKKITFHFGDLGYTTVSFLAESPNRTQIVLTQHDIPLGGQRKVDFYYYCLLSWSFWLINLKAFLEHGITLDQSSIIKNVNTKGIKLVAA